MGSFSEDSSEKNKLIIGIWAGVSSNDALSFPARTKRLLRRLGRERPWERGCFWTRVTTPDIYVKLAGL
jgi:hypothetical protein